MGLLDELKRRLAGRPEPRVQASELERATALHEAGELAQAEALYRRLLAADPGHAEAMHLLGLAHHQRGDHLAALKSINAAISRAPRRALFHLNLGNVLAALQETEAAADAFACAARLDPAQFAAWYNLGRARLELQDYEGARRALQSAFDIDPQFAGLRFELAATLIACADRQPGAREPYREAAALLEEHWNRAGQPHGARLMLAYSLAQCGRLSEAESHYLGVLDDEPQPGDRLKAHSNLANCYNQLGRVEEALHHYRRTLALNPALADTASSIAAFINYLPGTTPAEVLEAHADWARRYASAGRAAASWRNDRSAERSLRVGLVSPDLRRHPVTALCATTLEKLAGHGLSLHCYYNFSASDMVTERLRRTAAGWRDVHGLTDDQLHEHIREDGIDILVDMAGHTTHNRLGVFARKPAPVQVSWLGYFNTTGLRSMDGFITDPHSSPAGQDRWFVEQLVRLPHTRFCYEPWEFVPEVNPLPALDAGLVTFGCFNNLAKLNDAVLALWARVLGAVPGSRLVVQAQSLDDAPNRERFAARAAALGIPRGRLELRDFVPLERAARSYHGIDIALDPFPFCGGMTSFESLWMGVPVVTLEQPLIAGRQTLSMLHNLGHAEWVARSPEDYVRIAATLAADLPRLADTRLALRPRFAASPLADHEGYARDLSAALRAMWRDWAGRA